MPARALEALIALVAPRPYRRRLQRAMQALVNPGNAEMTEAATAHAELALARARQTLSFAPDIKRLSDEVVDSST